MELPKTYNPCDYEKDIYQLWLDANAFQPKRLKPETKNQSQSSTDNRQPTTFSSTQTAKPFVLMMPPPNITGSLHIGHALAMTMQDIIARYYRQKGDETLYLPGTDHASIATQAVVERELNKKGIKKQDLGREKFVKEIWQWKNKYHKRIVDQLKSLGVSCDWSREAFTFSDDYSTAVNHAFKLMYDRGLIYKGDYLVNWSVKGGTAISDDEVEYIEQQGVLYYLKYPVVQNPKSEAQNPKQILESDTRSCHSDRATASGGTPCYNNDNGNRLAANTPRDDKADYITVATTRPETMLGDTAVAVNPTDKRYKHFIGATVKLPLTDRVIPIIADKSIAKSFGSGAVKVTPAHDKADWDLGQKYNLPTINIINIHGRLTSNAPAIYRGMKVLEAREAIVDDLQKLGLLEKTEPITHRVGVSQRHGDVIEPLVSKQWFVKMKPLAAKAIETVKSGQIKIIPKRFEKIYFHWMENIRDWCISRQLWWGHRLPVWYKYPNFPLSKGENKGVLKKDIAIEDCDILIGAKSPGKGWLQEEDVLDTWFSSGLFPFTTLGWPDTDAPDYKKYYPTSVLETGYDIIFFWVARMIMMGLELTGQVPFHIVYLNGLVRDEHGRKMSKSLGNVVEPVELSNQWGTDAVRMALVIGTSPGNDVNFSISRAKGYRNFANKIWNASRFVLTQINSHSKLVSESSDLVLRQKTEDRIRNNPLLSKEGQGEDISPPFQGGDQEGVPELSEADIAVLKSLNQLITDVTHNFEHYRFSQAGEKLYEWFWHQFCDIIIEAQKKRLKSGGDEGAAARCILWQCLSANLIMLHPFMPFITETIWQNIPLELRKEKLLITAKWPQSRNV